jgi:hypothetical protein
MDPPAFMPLSVPAKAVQFRILGPVAIARDGATLPANPPNALQIAVSRLRNVLGEEAVIRRADGCELRLDGPDAVDAARFERLASQGREALARGENEAAARLLAQALELGRGPALQDVAAANRLGR